MTLLRGNKDEKKRRRQVKVEKNNRQTNKYGDIGHLLRLTECELVRNSLRPVLNGS